MSGSLTCRATSNIQIPCPPTKASGSRPTAAPAGRRFPTMASPTAATTPSAPTAVAESSKAGTTSLYPPFPIRHPRAPRERISMQAPSTFISARWSPPPARPASRAIGSISRTPMAATRSPRPRMCIPASTASPSALCRQATCRPATSPTTAESAALSMVIPASTPEAALAPINSTV